MMGLRPMGTYADSGTRMDLLTSEDVSQLAFIMGGVWRNEFAKS